MSPFRYLRRSIFARLTLLSVAISILLFYQLVLAPALNSADSTGGSIGGSYAMSTLFEVAKSGEVPLSELGTTEVFRRIVANNPDVRIYWQFGHQVFSYGGDPLYLHLAEDVRREGNNPVMPEDCQWDSYGSQRFTEDGRHGSVFFSSCSGYFEYRETVGIEALDPTAWEVVDFFLKRSNVYQYRFDNFILIAGAFLFVAVLTIIQAGFGLRKVTNEAATIDVAGAGRHLTEKGLPAEVKPFVRAINRMLDRIEEAHEKQGFFLAAAAHELRTPLTILRSRLDLLEASETKEEVIDDVRTMTRLVEQLLRLSHVQSAPELDDEAVDLCDIAEEICAVRADLAIAEKTELVLECPDEPIIARGSREMISLALSNLIDNAIAVSNAGSEIAVCVLRSREIQVRDNGPGIPADLQEGILDPFVKNSSSQVGHGLGLAIVKSVMDMHNGAVSFDTSADGTTFILRFPA